MLTLTVELNKEPLKEQLSLEEYIRFGFVTNDKYLFDLNEMFFGGAGGFIFCVFAENVITNLFLSTNFSETSKELVDNWIIRLKGNIPDEEFQILFEFVEEIFSFENQRRKDG